MKIRHFSIIALGLTFFATANATPKPTLLHCKSTYHGKKFTQAIILSGVNETGPLLCTYKDNQFYYFPQQYNYIKALGPWKGAPMPGGHYCGVANGGSYNTCLFQVVYK